MSSQPRRAGPGWTCTLFSHLGAKCVKKQKGTGTQNRRQTSKELAKQEQYGPRIYSDFFYMSEATALEQKGLTQNGVKFFADFIQQTGVRRFINKSDGEPGCCSKGLRRSTGQESPMGDHHANGAIESVVRTLKAQMRATRFGLESRLGRHLAHDDFDLDPDLCSRHDRQIQEKSRWQRALRVRARQAGDSLEFGEHFFMKEAKGRGSGVLKKDWETRLMEARHLGQHARTGAMIGITADGIVCGRLGVDCPKQSVGIKCRGILDRRACQRLRSTLRLIQAQPRQRGEREGRTSPEKEQSQRGGETERPKEK